MSKPYPFDGFPVSMETNLLQILCDLDPDLLSVTKYPVPEILHYSFCTYIPVMCHVPGLCILENSNRLFRIQLKHEIYSGTSQKHALLDVFAILSVPLL